MGGGERRGTPPLVGKTLCYEGMKEASGGTQHRDLNPGPIRRYVTPSQHLFEGSHKTLWAPATSRPGLLSGVLRAWASSCPDYWGAVFGGSCSGPGPPAAALALAGGSALNYSDEVGHTKDRNLFLIKTKQNAGPKPLGC